MTQQGLQGNCSNFFSNRWRTMSADERRLYDDLATYERSLLLSDPNQSMDIQLTTTKDEPMMDK